ncbi:carboxylesterase 15-like [Phragmites australis]|uniref:carboxylesterase 15-like n=1 Tax=Phragmites australis TaxID=29695 RepID=UPI002D777F39|nr:carboxylesterase 15-like [Phragmites australis]
MSSSTSPLPHVVEDCLGLVQLLSDGTVKRAPAALVLPDNAPLPSAAPVKWKDVVYDETHDLSLRMYVPSADAGDGCAKKLPVFVYFHGGGFCIGSFAMADFHAACLRLAAELPAVVLSADYRLAPEHRLPAALDDVSSLFSWLRAQASSSAATDPWLAESADFGRVFISGDSAGANIAHHAVVGCGSGSLAAAPAHIAGCVLLWPYFGGEQRTASEAACPADAFMTLALYDQMWRLALPAGATRDHPVANPFGPDSPVLSPVDLPPLLVASGDRDMLIDRSRDYVARLKAAGKNHVKLVEFAGQGHAFSIFKPNSEAAAELIRVVRQFVYGCDAPAPAPAPPS